MNRRLITLALCATTVLLAAVAINAAAQLDELKNTTPEMRAKALTDLMKAKLGLTSEQESKVADLNLKYAKKMEPVIKGSAGPFKKMREAKRINEEKETALKRILSPQQFDKFLAAKEEMREKFEEKMEEKARGQE
jgi:hypothetical protein